MGVHEVEESLEKVLGNEEELPLLVSLLLPSISLLYIGKKEMNNQKHLPASVCDLKLPVLDKGYIHSSNSANSSMYPQVKDNTVQAQQ